MMSARCPNRALSTHGAGKATPRMSTCWSPGCAQQMAPRRLLYVGQIVGVGQSRVLGPAQGALPYCPAASAAGKIGRLPPPLTPLISLSNLGSPLVTLGCGAGPGGGPGRGSSASNAAHALPARHGLCNSACGPNAGRSAAGIGAGLPGAYSPPGAAMPTRELGLRQH